MAAVEDDRVAAVEAMLVGFRTETDRTGDDWSDLDTTAFATDEEMATWRQKQETERGVIDCGVKL